MTTNSFKHADQPQMQSSMEVEANLYEQLNMSDYKPNNASNAVLCELQIGDSEPAREQKNNAGDDDEIKKGGADKAEKPNEKLEAPEGSARKKRLDFEIAIKKADEQLTDKDYDMAIKELHYLSLLRKEPEQKPGLSLIQPKKELNDKELELNAKKMSELDVARKEVSRKLLTPIEARMRYAQFLVDSGGFSEAAKVALEARALAERFARPVKVTNHIKLSPLELENPLLGMEALSFERNLPPWVDGLHPFANSMKDANVFLAKLYLGPDEDWSIGVPKEIGDGTFFDPVKAFDAAEKARQTTKDFHGYNALSLRAVNSAEIQNLYKALNKVFGDPAAHKLSDRKNADGQKFDPERISEIRKKFEKMRKDPSNSAFSLDIHTRTMSIMGDLIAAPYALQGSWGLIPNYQPEKPEQKK
ncbi:MAG: hypothetical protein K2X93_16615 [Candidatus Obscuribacterales bacterium]|nr:hypothetical protein [Candidatus Obscuribacterales bacterium]